MWDPGTALLATAVVAGGARGQLLVGAVAAEAYPGGVAGGGWRRAGDGVAQVDARARALAVARVARGARVAVVARHARGRVLHRWAAAEEAGGRHAAGRVGRLRAFDAQAAVNADARAVAVAHVVARGLEAVVARRPGGARHLR